MRRLYLGRVLATIRFFDNIGEYPYVLQLIINHRIEGVYKGNTPDEIINQLKANGYQVWGKNPLDYADYPRSALDYILQKSYLIHEYGMSEDEAHKALTIADHTETDE